MVYFLENIFDDIGHSFCKIDIDAEHQHLVPKHLTKFIGKPYGFYPNSNDPNGKSEAYYDVVSAFHEERKHFDNVNEQKSGTATHVWHISFAGCVKGLERMYEIETTKPKYDLMCFNCTDAAISIGRACSAPVPDAGIPDLSVLESLRGIAKENDDWAQKVWNLWKDSDGSYSSPLGLLVNLNYTNMKYGEKE